MLPVAKANGPPGCRPSAPRSARRGEHPSRRRRDVPGRLRRWPHAPSRPPRSPAHPPWLGEAPSRRFARPRDYRRVARAAVGPSRARGAPYRSRNRGRLTDRGHTCANALADPIQEVLDRGFRNAMKHRPVQRPPERPQRRSVSGADRELRPPRAE